MTRSLQRLLVIAGIVAVPFYELLFKAFPFVKVVAPSTREPKQAIAVFIALSIGLLAIFQGTLKSFSNKWLLAIPAYLLISLFMSPSADLFINSVEVGDFYFWKPFAHVLCFMLLIVAVASMKDGLREILNVMAICGVVMAGYVILQKMGLDQFWLTKSREEIGGVMEPSLGGNLGQSTVVASFLVMLIPITIYFRNFIQLGIISVAIVLTQSDAALLAGLFIGIAHTVYSRPKLAAPIFISLVIGITIISIACVNPDFKRQIKDRFSGRTEAWASIYKDIKDGPLEGIPQDFSFTGVGLGRYPFIFPDKHSSHFVQAHNDFLEFAYNCGFAGLFLLLAGLWKMFTNVLSNLDYLNFIVLLSFVSVLICSLASFPFQLGAHQFYSAVLFGILNNRSIAR